MKTHSANAKAIMLLMITLTIQQYTLSKNIRECEPFNGLGCTQFMKWASVTRSITAMIVD